MRAVGVMRGRADVRIFHGYLIPLSYYWRAVVSIHDQCGSVFGCAPSAIRPLRTRVEFTGLMRPQVALTLCGPIVHANSLHDFVYSSETFRKSPGQAAGCSTPNPLDALVGRSLAVRSSPQMQSWIDQARDKLFDIISQAKRDDSNLQLRVSFVG